MLELNKLTDERRLPNKLKRLLWHYVFFLSDVKRQGVVKPPEFSFKYRLASSLFLLFHCFFYVNFFLLCFNMKSERERTRVYVNKMLLQPQIAGAVVEGLNSLFQVMCMYLRLKLYLKTLVGSWWRHQYHAIL